MAQQKKVVRRTIRQDAINLPNLLTMGRVVMIPLVIVCMMQQSRVGNFWAAVLYSLAAVTDAIDGWLARRQGLTSILGQFLDPLADKLLIITALIFMVDLGHVPAWAVAVIASRELSITALRTIAISEGVVIAASRGGKDKAALQMVAVLMLILHDSYYLDFWFFALPVNLNAVGLVMLALSVLFAITSAGEYIALFVEAVEAKEKRLAEDDE